MILLCMIALGGEFLARVAGKPALLSLTSVRVLRTEEGPTRFSAAKAERELGVRFRPVDETLADEIAGFANGMLPAAAPSGATAEVRA